MEPKARITRKRIENNLFFFQFHHRSDKAFVMESKPWNFDHHALILSDIKGNDRPSKLPLHKVPFWVRVYDLPLRGRNNENNARALGEKLGTYVRMEKSDVIGINKSLRIRVLLDARKPLPCSVKFKLMGDRIQELPVNLEILPVFC